MEGFEFLGPYAKRIFGSNTPSPVNSKTAGSKKPTDFSALHKKKNVNFGRSAGELKVNRLKEAEERRKDKRTQVIMEKRAGNLLSNGLTLAKTVAETEKAETNGLKQSRKDQLSRWKQEKEATKNNVPKKVPFKPSAPASALPVRPVPLPPVKVNPIPGTRTEKPVSSRLVPGNKVANGAEAPRRVVTRAMTKAQSTTVSSGAIGATASRLKNLKITAKPGNPPTKEPTPAKTKKLDVPRTAVSPKKGIPKPTDKSPVPMDDMISPRLEVQEQIPNQPNLAQISSSLSDAQQSRTPEKSVPETKKKVKKPKGMQFDAKYVEYNQSFIKAGELLKGFADQWSSILVESSDIPEDVIGQINSTIGQAKLLLDSKLPQFAELLYFYLSRHQDPGPVLPCDLEGWWDVAVISIEKVQQLFVDLAKLKENGWEVKEERRIPLKSKQTSAPVIKKTYAGDSVASPKIKSRPNAGLMQFLAQKRKKMNQGEQKMDEIVVTVSPPRNKPTSPERKFEGGFFDIRSPVRKPSLINSNSVNRVSRRSSCITPSRRQSEVSLRMLAVRNSMGPICKIGVIEKAPESQIDTDDE